MCHVSGKEYIASVSVSISENLCISSPNSHSKNELQAKKVAQILYVQTLRWSNDAETTWYCFCFSLKMNAYFLLFFCFFMLAKNFLPTLESAQFSISFFCHQMQWAQVSPSLCSSHWKYTTCVTYFVSAFYIIAKRDGIRRNENELLVLNRIATKEIKKKRPKLMKNVEVNQLTRSFCWHKNEFLSPRRSILCQTQDEKCDFIGSFNDLVSSHLWTHH